MLVLNLGHSPLYRHLSKCLNVELLKNHLFIHPIRLRIGKQIYRFSIIKVTNSCGSFNTFKHIVIKLLIRHFIQ